MVRKAFPHKTIESYPAPPAPRITTQTRQVFLSATPARTASQSDAFAQLLRGSLLPTVVAAAGCIVGLDYYPGNEHVVANDGTMRELGDGERRGFAAIGLKPTQYRCASESLLRRFRKEGELPRLHPLVDLCNAVSLAYATPIAVFDVAKIASYVQVRYATGGEEYLSFSGDTEYPAAGEVIFADEAGQAHARRWTNRQSAMTAVRDTTSAALIVAEALHASAAADVPELLATIADELEALWSVRPAVGVLTADSPRFSFGTQLARDES